MQPENILMVLAVTTALAYFFGRSRSLAQARPLGGIRALHSLPFYYGMRAALWCSVPAVLFLGLWLMCEEQVINSVLLSHLPEHLAPHTATQRNLLLGSIENLASGALDKSAVDPGLLEAARQLEIIGAASQRMMAVLVMSLAVLGGCWGWLRISPQRRAQQEVEGVFKFGLMFSACIAVLITLGIVLSVLFESLRFFQSVPLTDFLFGLEWSPQTAIRADQVGASGSFGIIPLFAGTLLISLIAMLVAVPVGLMSAVYLAEYASPGLRSFAKPALEVLAGIPTVVYGFFAALTVAPFIRDTGAHIGLSVSSESALAAGLVMGIMIIPFISSLSDDVINAVPQALRDGSLGLGATRSETIRLVIFPAALPGIVGGVLLAVSRAIGETMIVVMAAGLAAKLTANPLETVTTITVQIVTLLVGDQEFDSPKTLAAFALGLALFVVTLLLNIVALKVVKKYRERYD